jgi:hypothetical protein
MLVGTKVCHFNIRRFGQTEYQSGETKSLPGLPRAGDLFHTELDGKNIRIRVTSQGHAPPPHLNGVFEFTPIKLRMTATRAATAKPPQKILSSDESTLDFAGHKQSPAHLVGGSIHSARQERKQCLRLSSRPS